LLRIGGLAYACNDTLSEAAITDIMGPRLSAALALRPKHLDRPSLLGGCAVVADCSMIVAWLQTRSSTGAASSGSSPWKIANWSITPQQIDFAVISTGGSSWSIAVTFEHPSGVYPSPISLAPTSFTLLTGSSNQFVSVGASMLPVAGYQFSLNAPSSVGAKVNFVALQSGIR
jgi:hypothetical protein